MAYGRCDDQSGRQTTNATRMGVRPTRLAIGSSLAWLPAWAILLLMLACGAAVAGDSNEHYQAQTIVTGQRAETRLPGLARCLEDVLVKVSGDPTIAREPAVAEMAANAVAFLGAFRYRDRLEGIPIHDEQGSRDRPYDLTVDFDPAKINAALRSLGREPWAAPRPRIAVFLAVRFNEVTYLLASDGSHGRDQRDAFAAASWKFGLPIALPSERVLAAAGLSFETLPSADLASLDGPGRTAGGDIALAGRMTWSQEALGWIADWRLASEGKTYRWQISGVSFDAAFRSAMSGALQILSRNGVPE